MTITNNQKTINMTVTTSAIKAGKTLQVNNDNINETGQLTVCRILQEINLINDQTIATVYGGLNYSKINVQHYHIDIQGAAEKGDTLKIDTAYSVLADGRLEVRTVMRKTKSKKTTEVLNSYFIFTNSSTKNK
jgi:hypothetical protein